jgi:hypothetical protein
MYADNDERAIFFAKGVVETVKIELGSRYHSCAWLDGSMLPIYSITIKRSVVFIPKSLLQSTVSL